MVNTKIRYLLFSNYLNLLGFSIFTPLFAIFVLNLRNDPSLVGLAWGVNLYAAALMILLFGKYEDRWRHKEQLVVIGFFLLAAGGAAYLLVHSIWQLFAIQAFNAIGTGVLTPAWRTVYAKSEDKGRETLEWSFVDGGAKFFSATGAVIGGLILKFYSFRAIFILICLIQLLAGIVALSLLKNKSKREAEINLSLS
ncbi:MAG TPA: MFS transporter [Candidatus Saccharimonadales bacterium]|nr:MFS transporter [Candidatus Saccharimonadales bacterium]